MNKLDTNFYSRQIKTFGIETMVKLQNLRILIIGMRGLGVEIAKNIVLSGVKEVKILDKNDIITFLN
jgi:ubiquitin-activating enzyme E1